MREERSLLERRANSMVMLQKKPNGNFEDLGQREFAIAPQLGHYVTMNDRFGIGQAYQVIAVIHPLEPDATSSNLILRHVGTSAEMRGRIAA